MKIEYWWRWRARLNKVKWWFLNRTPKALITSWVNQEMHKEYTRILEQHIQNVQALDIGLPRSGGYCIVICRLHGYERVKVIPIRPDEDYRTARDLIEWAEHHLGAKLRFVDAPHGMRDYIMRGRMR